MQANTIHNTDHIDLTYWLFSMLPSVPNIGKATYDKEHGRDLPADPYLTFSNIPTKIGSVKNWKNHKTILKYSYQENTVFLFK